MIAITLTITVIKMIKITKIMTKKHTNTKVIKEKVGEINKPNKQDPPTCLTPAPFFFYFIFFLERGGAARVISSGTAIEPNQVSVQASLGRFCVLPLRSALVRRARCCYAMKISLFLFYFLRIFFFIVGLCLCELFFLLFLSVFVLFVCFLLIVAYRQKIRYSDIFHLC